VDHLHLLLLDRRVEDGVMAARPRVLVITPDFPPAVGGIQLLVDQVLRNAPGLDARVVTLTSPGAAEWDAAGAVDVVRYPMGSLPRLSKLGLNGLAVREALRFRPDVILAAHIVASPAAALLRRLLKVPTVLYLYGKEVGASPTVARFAVRNATSVIAISRYTRDLALGAGADPSRIELVTPGVKVVSPARVTKDARPTLVTVARLEDRYKGHDMLARALPLIRARVPDAQWVVIGEGSLRGEIERVTASNGSSDAVRLLGSVANGERDEWLGRSHVFSMPSRLPAGKAAGEGFGIVYLEAGLHHLPVVAGNVGGTLDAVVHEHTGLLVDPTDALALADAIGDLLLDPVRAQAMGAAGAEHARGFSWSIIGGRVEAVLRSVAATA
jgi:phosphatidylinositol alpha-1,6-mannosyltransferase